MTSPSVSIPDDLPASPPPPPVPARSPLRPRPRHSNSSATTTPTTPTTPASTTETQMTAATTTKKKKTAVTLNRSTSLADLLHKPSVLTTSSSLDLPLATTTTPTRAPSPRVSLPLSLEAPSRPTFAASSSTAVVDASPPPPPPPGRSKRHHALLELLSSERAYASDLALVRELYIPAALGHPAHPFPLTPPASSSSSGRTLSTASDDLSQSQSPPPAPMTPEDVRIIFSNIAELALFADMFADRLEDALGDILPGGRGPDRVGALFLSMVSSMEKPYLAYITRHPIAVDRLAKLPQTPALAAYLAHARSSAASFSHAWDLPSLLIKPVQRLLKYALLIQAVLDDTPLEHPDAECLRRAREAMDAVSHAVNDAQRRRETVRDVLVNGVRTPDALTASLRKLAKSKVSSSSSSSSATSLTTPPPTSTSFSALPPPPPPLPPPLQLPESAPDAALRELETDLRAVAALCDALSADASAWSASARAFVTTLSTWAASFGRAIGVQDSTAAEGGEGESDGGSEAYDAFVSLVTDELGSLAAEADTALLTTVTPSLHALKAATSNPIKVVDAMRALEPGHVALLGWNAASAKGARPDKSLLDASTSYAALRTQLSIDLPILLPLLRAGVRACVGGVVGVQGRFWEGCRERWGRLWDALRVEGERNAGCEETVRVWRTRVKEVEREMERFRSVRPLGAGEVWAHVVRVHPHSPSSQQQHQQQQQEKKVDGAKASKVGAAMSMFGALEPDNARPKAPMRSKTSGRDLTSTAAANGNGALDELSALLPPGTRPTSYPTDREPASNGKGARTSAGSLPERQHTSERGREPESGATSGSSKVFGLGKGFGLARRRSGSRKPAPPPVTVPTGSPRVEGGMPSPSALASSASVPSRLAHSTSNPGLPHSASATSGLPPSSAGARPRSGSGTGPTLRVSAKWAHARAKYVCAVVHACEPPPGVSYFGLPFFRLKRGERYEVLKEAGHPAAHEGLPLYVDEGEDCLLLARDGEGKVGWCLASFMYPVEE